ncbi:hypothetical protein CRD36_06625, partial [Paremcibacter congregatus]
KILQYQILLIRPISPDGEQKTELIYQQEFGDQEEAERAIFEYIEVFYNQNRIHSANNYLSPIKYENLTKAA